MVPWVSPVGAFKPRTERPHLWVVRADEEVIGGEDEAAAADVDVGPRGPAGGRRRERSYHGPYRRAGSAPDLDLHADATRIGRYILEAEVGFLQEYRILTRGRNEKGPRVPRVAEMSRPIIGTVRVAPTLLRRLRQAGQA